MRNFRSMPQQPQPGADVNAGTAEEMPVYLLAFGSGSASIGGLQNFYTGDAYDADHAYKYQGAKASLYRAGQAA
jgi:hypothetical protein